MKFVKPAGFMLMLAICVSTPTLVLAQDPELEDPEVASLAPGEQKVTEDIASDFSDFAGDDAVNLVETLRHGGELTYDKEVLVDDLDNPVKAGEGEPADADGNLLDEEGNIVYEQIAEIETVTVGAGPMGYGEVSLALGLAEALLGDGAAYGDIVDALSNIDGDGILDLRAAGMGWGQIFRSYDLTPGEVISAIKSRGASKAGQFAEHTLGPNAGGRPETAGGKAAGLENRPDQPARPDRPEQPARPDRPEWPDLPDRPDRPERPERPERPDRPSRP